ncbi:MAG: hypothetical protein GQ553_04425 [Nitrosomonadaceae bacterium]|nr:hypothetical protein [Nitrosomonadaceae bacterium]
MPDLYCECIYRDDRSCTAAPYYGSCDCEWAVDKGECPEPFAAIKCLPVCDEDGTDREYELREEVSDDAHRIPAYGKEW